MTIEGTPGKVVITLSLVEAESQVFVDHGAGTLEIEISDTLDVTLSMGQALRDASA